MTSYRFKSDYNPLTGRPVPPPADLPLRMKAAERAREIVRAALDDAEQTEYLQYCYDLLECMEPGQRFMLTPSPYATWRVELLIAAVCLVMEAHPDRYTLHENYNEIVREELFLSGLAKYIRRKR